MLSSVSGRRSTASVVPRSVAPARISAAAMRWSRISPPSKILKLRSITTAFVCTLLLTATLAATPAQAGIDVDLGASFHLGNDTDVYLAISSRYFDRDRHVVDRVAVRYHNPDDVAVALFLSRHSGRSGDDIYRLRREGVSWWDISVRLGVRPDVWFVPVHHKPGPPYGNAYGHWKNRNKNKHHHFVLSDSDTRNLVAVRTIHEYYGVSAEVAMQWPAH